MYEVSTLLKFSLLIPIIIALVTLYHVYQSVVVWQLGLGKNTFARIRYNFVSFSGLIMLWFYYYWNLLGANYYG